MSRCCGAAKILGKLLLCSILNIRHGSQSVRKLKSEQCFGDRSLNNSMIASRRKCNPRHPETVSNRSILAVCEMNIEGTKCEYCALGGRSAASNVAGLWWFGRCACGLSSSCGPYEAWRGHIGVSEASRWWNRSDGIRRKCSSDKFVAFRMPGRGSESDGRRPILKYSAH